MKPFAKYLSLALVLMSTFASAQVATGTPQFGSYGGGPFDTVNLGNLNVHFAIPILHKAGRGLPFSYDLSYDSSIWVPVTSSGITQWQPVGTWGWNTATAALTGYVTVSITTQSTPCTSGAGTRTTYNNWAFHDNLGRVHRFFGSTFEEDNVCHHPPVWWGAPVTATSTDNSGYSIVATGQGTATVTSKSGQVLANLPVNSQLGSSTFTDANGNRLTASASGQYFDTLSSTAPVLTMSGSGTPASPTKFTYTPPSGTNVSYTMNYTQYTAATNFGVTGVNEYGRTSVPLVTSLLLPDDAAGHPDRYTFTYEPTGGSCAPLSGTASCVTGRIQAITLPTGGSITYVYTGGTGTGIYSDGSTAGLSRILSPSTSCAAGGCWQYARTLVSGTAGPGSTWKTTVIDPTTQQNQTVINFAEDTATTYNMYETQRQVYQGAVSVPDLLATTTQCYNGVYASCDMATVTSPIYTLDKYSQLAGGQIRASSFIYNGSFSASGLLSDDKEYDFGVALGAIPSNTLLLRHTTISYASLSNGIADHPWGVSVTDAGGNLLSKTTYSYDEYTTYPLQTTTGTPQHTSVSGSRGNLTSISRNISATTALASHLQYFDTGTTYKSFDVNGAITTFAYGSTTSCGNSFPTSVTLPITSPALSTSTTWNCTGGVATSSTDVNGNNTSVTYTDPNFWRPASLQDQASNTTNYSYTPAGTSTPASIESRMLFNSSSSISEQLSTLDGFGRPYLTQREQSPSSTNYDTVQTNYDVVGRPVQGTMPYIGTAGQTTTMTPATTTTYDPLNRVTQTTDGGGGYVSYSYSQNDVLQTLGPAPTGESTKRKQLEYDALGQLISVCEITSATGSGTCGQSTTYTGYWAKYAYDFVSPNTRVTVTQNAQSGTTTQTRIYLYDLLGRLVSETNPETGSLSPGTSHYVFDADSVGTCSGTYNGDLVKRVDNNGTSTCYTYDALHRSISIRYSDSTPTKTLIYDAATLSTTAMSNAKGNLAEAYTGPSGSKITDEFFSYSVRGELTDTYEFTPHSGSTYYHVTAGFWANGAVSSLSSNLSGVPSQTYGVDSEGRPYSVSAASGQNPVTSTTYNLSTYTNKVTFGSLDSDTFTLDPNTGRMTEYNFAVGSLHDFGDLTWNTNGSLKKLAIHDALNTPDTQTCNYSHDDMSRIASANCGTPWNQTFSYDPFGNVTKNATAGISFVPGYSTTTNQFTSIGMLTPTYDGDGRLTNDTVHSYGWDAESKMVSVDTISTTYDALGRMVENNVSGTYTQIVYCPFGNKFALINGSTLQKAYLPLPMGATAVYTSAGLAYYRHSDHLGSSRLATTPTRTMYSSTAYGPYGEPYTQAGTTDVSFTGHDQDTIAGMHDFPFRKYSPVQGRWLSPDPSALGAVDITNPQSWNRYTYVTNRPLNHVDSLGLNEDDCDTDDFDDCGGGGGGDDGGGGAFGGDGSGLGGDGGFGGISADPSNGGPPQVPGWSVTVTGTFDPVIPYDPLSFCALAGLCSGNGGNTAQCGAPIPYSCQQPGNSPAPKSPYSTGCTVSASCGPTQNTRGMSHCTVTVGQNGTYEAYDGGPTGSIWNSTLTVVPGPGAPPGPNAFYISDSCSMAACVPTVMQRINNANMWYSFPFQNSNNAASMMLNQCGADVTLPVSGPQ